MKISAKDKEKKTISAIIPIYNEEKTLGTIVERLIQNPLINEVICVNDGSTDQSITILEKFDGKVKVIDLGKNYGKGYALAKGVDKASSDIVAFFDADLINLKNSHIVDLLKPVLKSNKYKAVLGYPTGPSRISRYICKVFKDITGERAYYRKDLIPHLKEITKTRFGVEIYLNGLFKPSQIKKLPLETLYHLYKQEKHGGKKAVQETMKEIFEIVQEVGKREGLLPRNSNVSYYLKKIIPMKEIKKLLKNIV